MMIRVAHPSKIEHGAIVLCIVIVVGWLSSVQAGSRLKALLLSSSVGFARDQHWINNTSFVRRHWLAS